MVVSLTKTGKLNKDSKETKAGSLVYGGNSLPSKEDSKSRSLK